MSDEQCSNEVTTYLADRWPRRSQCSRKAVVFVEGKGYCKQHSPDATAKREAVYDRKCRLDRLERNIAWDTKSLGYITLKLHGKGVPLPDELSTACDKIITLEEERKKMEGEG